MQVLGFFYLLDRAKLGREKNFTWKSNTLLTSHHTPNLDHFRARNQLFDILTLKGAFLGVFLPPGRGENWGRKFFCHKTKLHVHMLLTSYHTSNLDHFWARYQLFDILTLKGGILGGCFYPLGRAKIRVRKKFDLEVKVFVLTLLTSYHTSKSDHFLSPLSTFLTLFGPFLDALSTFLTF